MRVLVTGASGFLARSLINMLLSQGLHDVIGSVRSSKSYVTSEIEIFVTGEINGDTAWDRVLEGVDVIIHTAARAHVIKDDVVDPASAFYEVNVSGTIALAAAAIRNNVKRFIFVSSIGVNGSSTSEDEAFSEVSIPNPMALYAISKYEAEQQLSQLVENSMMQLVIVRPPLVYAEDAPGNFGRLLKIVSTSFPLPFALVKNRKSFIYRENLSDFLCKCVDHPVAGGELFLVSDAEDVSTPELLTVLSRAMNKKLYLIPVPMWLMKGVTTLLGKTSIYEQLCDSLVIDSTKARTLLNWNPPFKVRDALRLTGEAFTNEKL